MFFNTRFKRRNYVLSKHFSLTFGHNVTYHVTHWLCFQTPVQRPIPVQRAAGFMRSRSYRISAAVELRLNFRSTSLSALSNRLLTTGRLRHVSRGLASTCLCPSVRTATCISAAVVWYLIHRCLGAFKETSVQAISAADWCRSTCTIKDVAADI